MPEMPDIQVFSENLTKRLRGKSVVKARYLKAKRLNVSPGDLASALKNQKLVEIERSGKECIFVFSNGRRLAIHLMLSGGFDIQPTPSTTKFPVLSIEWDDGSELVVFDPRGLATVTLDPTESSVPDALSVTEDYLRVKIGENPKQLIKALLIDQSVIRGIGNAYADEILWSARISPKSIAVKIPPSEVSSLFKAISETLTRAVEEIRRLQPDALSGEERSFLSVHVKDRDLSPTGHKINIETVATKSTYFTEEQRYFC